MESLVEKRRKSYSSQENFMAVHLRRGDQGPLLLADLLCALQKLDHPGTFSLCDHLRRKHFSFTANAFCKEQNGFLLVGQENRNVESTTVLSQPNLSKHHRTRLCVDFRVLFLFLTTLWKDKCYFCVGFFSLFFVLFHCSINKSVPQGFTGKCCVHFRLSPRAIILFQKYLTSIEVHVVSFFCFSIMGKDQVLSGGGDLQKSSFISAKSWIWAFNSKSIQSDRRWFSSGFLLSIDLFQLGVCIL